MEKLKQVPELAETCDIHSLDHFTANYRQEDGELQIFLIESINKDTFKNATNLKQIQISEILLNESKIELDLSNCAKLEKIVFFISLFNDFCIDLTKSENQISNVINVKDLLVYNENKDRHIHHYSFDINNGPLIIDRSILSIPNIVIYFNGNSKTSFAGSANSVGSAIINWTNSISMAPIMFNSNLITRIKFDPNADPLYIDRTPIYMDPVRVSFERFKDESSMIEFNSKIMKELLNPSTTHICIGYIVKYNEEDKQEGLAIIPRKDQGLNDWIINIIL